MIDRSTTAMGRRRFLIGTAAASLVLGAGVRAAPAAATEFVWIGKNRWLFPAWESLSDPGDAALSRSLDLIERAASMFSERGVGLLVAVVPFKARYYESELPDGMALAESVKSRYARILAWARQRGITAVDLDAAILPVATGDQTIYYHTDQHWTSWSAEAAGVACADAIGANWQLGGVPGGGAKLGKWMSGKRLGDLTSLLPKERQAEIGDETYVVRQVYAAELAGRSTDGLLPAGSFPVHVVGNSFSRWGLPQRLSNALDRPVALTWLPGDIGPWQIMLGYVESPKFKKPPIAIVWQLNESLLPFGPWAPNCWTGVAQMQPEVWLARMKAAIGSQA
jgi:alginate O-acetyltransferase complex protein AlgJ